MASVLNICSFSWKLGKKSLFLYILVSIPRPPNLIKLCLSLRMLLHAQRKNEYGLFFDRADSLQNECNEISISANHSIGQAAKVPVEGIM
jgi:hypothetical protein